MSEKDKRELKELNNRWGFIIRHYCNSIGCKDCPLNRDPDDCESGEIQRKVLNLEEKDM